MDRARGSDPGRSTGFWDRAWLRGSQRPRRAATRSDDGDTGGQARGALLLHAIVHSAGVQDRDGGIWLLATLFGQFPFLAKLFADSAYAGSIFHTALGKVLPNLKTEIVRRSDRAKGFVPLPKRWIVERTIAWLNRCRRLAKDWENLNRSAVAFLKLASI